MKYIRKLKSEIENSKKKMPLYENVDWSWFTKMKNGQVCLRQYDEFHRPALIIFAVDWCIHCQRLKAELHKFNRRSSINTPILIVDAEKPFNADLANTLLGMQRSYPTIFCTNSAGVIIEKYEGDRSLASLEHHLVSLARVC